MSLAISEYIEFGEFNSKSEGFYVLSRDAPTPAEKLITENLHYMNGILDFSNITGERLYEQREIGYQFLLPNVSYAERKVVENKCKTLLMRPVEQRLYDTHDKGVYWLGKCMSVKVTDDQQRRSLTLNLDFSVYPFAIKDSSDSRFADDWNSFNFDADFAQPFTFTVDGSIAVHLMNIGESRISPMVICDATMTVSSGEHTFNFSPQKSTDYLFTLQKGMNDMTVRGKGNIKFVLKTEVMI